MSIHPSDTAFLRFLRCFVPFGFMASASYSFANPDPDVIYDVFPVQKSKYAFITTYTVQKSKRAQFENSWKNQARYFQSQEGYLYNKLLRQELPVDDKFTYMDINQWTTGDAFKAATSKGTREGLLNELARSVENGIDTPQCYKIVVDDTQFTPSEVIHSKATS